MDISAILGFDMETDIGSWTPYYKGLTKGTSKILEVLSDKKVDATFFFTGEAAQKYPSIVTDTLCEGHEVGCHTLYHETVGDEIYPVHGVKPILPQEVKYRLQVATEYVEKVAKVKMTSFRAPRLFGSTIMVNALEELGYTADATYPLYYYKERLEPYHPDRNDWTKKGDMNIVEIPNFADITMNSKDPYGRDCDQWPLFRTKGSNSLMKRIDSYIEYVGGKGISPIVLCFYFHPWEFVKMQEGLIYTGGGSVRPDPMIVKNCGDYALEQFKILIEMLKERDIDFYTARDFVKTYF